MNLSEWTRKFEKNEEKIKRVYDYYDYKGPNKPGKKHVFIDDLKAESQQDDKIYSKSLQ